MALNFLNDGYFAGKVGIGTDSPSARLEVATSSNTNVDIAHFSNSNEVVKIKHALDGLGSGMISIIDSSNNEDVRLSAQSNSWFNAGNVGIGTDSPDRKLHVKDSTIVVSEFEGTNTGSLMDLVNSNSSQLYNGIRFTQGATSKMAITHIADGTTKGYVQIGNSWATGSEILVVDGRTSNVGIGVTSPSAKLDVDGVARVRGGTYAADIDTKTDVAIVIAENDYIYTADTSSYLRKLIGKSGDIIKIGETGTSLIDGIDLMPGTTGGYVQVFNNNSVAAKFVDGKLGIGTTSPSHKLTVAGTTAHTTARVLTTTGNANLRLSTDNSDFAIIGQGGLNRFDIFDVNGNSTRLSIDSSGNVGIGTTTPQQKLDVVGRVRASYNTSNYYEIGASSAGGFVVGKSGGVETVNIRTYGNSHFNGGNFGIGTSSPTAKLHVAGTGLFTGLVSGITPVAAANFVTKAYVDGSGGGTGPFLPLAGGTMTGNLVVDGANITIDTDTAGNSLVWRESDSSTLAGQLRGYGNRGDIYLYFDGVKKTELSSSNDSFIPALHIGGTAAASGGVLQVTGSANISATVTATTFSGDLNGTINTATLATTQLNPVDNDTVATTAYVNNKIGLIPAGLVFQGTWNAATNTPTLTSGSGTTGNFYIVSTPGSTNLDGITDWKTGDWAVFIEQGQNDQWEKIDNSSVLDGFGTGGSVAGWAGSGTSNTLTNSPITFSGNNITIPGDTTITNGRLTVTHDTNNAAKIIQADTNLGNNSYTFEVDSSAQVSNMSAAGAMAVDVNSGRAFTIVGNGNVGIGTTSPTEKLEVRGGAVRISTTAGNDSGILAFGNYVNGTGYYDNGIFRSAYNQPTVSGNTLHMASYEALAFTTSPNPFGSQTLRMYIPGGGTKAGNVGIGTISPTAKLHLEGDAIIEGVLRADNVNLGLGGAIKVKASNTASDQYVAFGTTPSGSSGNATFTEKMRVTAPGGISFGSTGTAYGTSGQVLTSAGNASPTWTTPTTGTVTGGGSNTYLAKWTTATNINSSAMFQAASGNFSIGITTPNAKLSVANDISIGTSATDVLRLSNISGVGGIYGFSSRNLAFGSITNGEVMRVDNTNERVGIGTTSPSEKLQIEGKVYIQGNGQDWNETTPGPTRGSVHFDPGTTTADTGNALTFGASDTPGSPNEGSTAQAGIYTRTDGAYGSKMYFATTDSYAAGSKTRMMIDYNGNVGIGTTSPGNTLHVFKNATIGVITSPTVANAGFRIQDSGANMYVDGNSFVIDTAGYLTTTGSNDFDIGTNSTSRIKITGSGNVGIGTTSPGANLDVAGTAPVIRITNTTDPLGNGTVGSFEFFTKDSSTGATRTVSSIVCDNNAGSSVPEGELVFKTSLGGGGSPIATEKMRINATGAIKFNAYDSTNQTGTPTYMLGTDGSGNVVKVLGSGIPGVPGGSGTLNTVPLWTPDGDTLGNSIITQPSTGVVRVSGNSVYFSVTDTSAAARNIDIGHWVSGQTNIESQGGTLSIGTQSNHNIVFETNGSTKATILSGGNVGIGTTGPTSKLTIADTAFTTAYNSIKGLFFDNSNISSGNGNFGTGIEFGKLSNGGNLYKKAAIIPVQSGADSDQMGISFFVSNTASQASPVIEAMRVDYGGNVGIGVTEPSSKLTIETEAGDGTIELLAVNAATTKNKIIFSEAILGDASFFIEHDGAGAGADNLLKIHGDGSGGTASGITIRRDGKVGVGTDAPVSPLTVKSNSVSSGESGIIIQANGNTNSIIKLGERATDGGRLEMLDANVTKIALYTDGTDNYINAGNVGIGVTAPAAKLHVAGGIQMADDTATASATKVGTMRYRTGTEYVEVDGVDLADGWTFTSGWNAFGGGTSITNSTTFVSASGQGIYAGLGLTTSKTYKVVIAGTQPSGGYISIKAGTTGTSFGNISEQSFDKVLYATLTTVSGNTNSFYIRLADHASNTSIVITKLEIQEVTLEDASYADMCMQTGASTYEWVNIVRNTY